MADKQGKSSKFLVAIREFLEGAVVREPMLVALKEKAILEQALLLTLFGDMLGVPMPSSYYSLRLLPHVMPLITPWKRSLLRQKDWTDHAFD
ncbi:MAG: hypothetical protein HY914_04160 [Desulfomonile tiedjei]|nr:hypothetical protein [Desulfomonile tiedjei]